MDDSGNIANRTEESSLDLSDLFGKRLGLVADILAEDCDLNRPEFRLHDQLLPDIQIMSESAARSFGSISHSAVLDEEMQQEVVSVTWGKYGALPGAYFTDVSQATIVGQLVAFAIDNEEIIGRTQAHGFVHYLVSLSPRLVVTDLADMPDDAPGDRQVVRQRQFPPRTAEQLAKIFNIKVEFIGVLNHWKVYQNPDEPRKFWYVNANPEVLYNCFYEV